MIHHALKAIVERVIKANVNAGSEAIRARRLKRFRALVLKFRTCSADAVEAISAWKDAVATSGVGNNLVGISLF